MSSPLVKTVVVCLLYFDSVQKVFIVSVTSLIALVESVLVSFSTSIMPVVSDFFRT